MVRLFGKGMEAMVIDFRALTQKNQDAFSMQPLFSGRFGQRMAAGRFCGIGSRKAKWKKWCEYFVSFGEEEAVKWQSNIWISGSGESHRRRTH